MGLAVQTSSDFVNEASWVMRSIALPLNSSRKPKPPAGRPQPPEGQFFDAPTVEERLDTHLVAAAVRTRRAPPFGAFQMAHTATGAAIGTRPPRVPSSRSSFNMGVCVHDRLQLWAMKVGVVNRWSRHPCLGWEESLRVRAGNSASSWERLNANPSTPTHLRLMPASTGKATPVT